MFFLVSGYFFKADYNFCYFLKKKAKSMLIPYLFFGITCWLIAKVISGVSTELLFNLFWKNTYPLAICGALWFLTALFLAEIFYYFILKYVTVQNPLGFNDQLLCKTENWKIFFCSELLLLCGWNTDGCDLSTRLISE